MKKLLEICIDNILGNRERFWTESEKPPHKLVFRGPGEVFQWCHLAEKFLYTLSYGGDLDDALMEWLAENVKLKDVYLDRLGKASGQGLQALKTQQLSSFHVENSETTFFSMADVFTALSGSTESLTEVGLHAFHVFPAASCAKKLEDRPAMIKSWTPASRLADAFGKFQHLQSLSLETWYILQEHFDHLLVNLPRLRQLRLRLTVQDRRVADLSPLLHCKDTLQTLALLDSPLSRDRRTLDTLNSLGQLRHLDLSLLVSKRRQRCRSVDQAFCTASFLEHGTEAHPMLTFLNLQGRDAPPGPVLRTYIAHHKELRYLNLIHNDACEYDMFREGSFRVDDTTSITVLGHANLRQLTVTLEAFVSRVRLSPYALNTHVCFKPVMKLVSLTLGGPATRLTQEELRQACTNLLEPIAQMIDFVDWKKVGAKGGMDFVWSCWQICHKVQDPPFKLRDKSTDVMLVVLKRLRSYGRIGPNSVFREKRPGFDLLEMVRTLSNLSVPTCLQPLRTAAQDMLPEVMAELDPQRQ